MIPSSRTATKLGVAVAVGAFLRRRAVRELRQSEGTGELPRPRRVSWLSRFLDPTGGPTDDPPVPPPLPEGRTVTVPGRGEMFYRSCGDPTEGVPVLLLHGWMASADLNWFLLFEPLGAHHPVVAPDHRGHGRGIRAPHAFTLEDCADDAAGLLRTLGIEKAIVVGYSMGGPIATLLWRRHPDLVAGLVLQATALEWKSAWWERARWRLMGILGVLLRWTAGRLLLARIMGQRGDIPAPLAPHRAWLEGEFRRIEPDDIAEAGRALGEYDARPFVADIDVPTVVVVTTKDQLVPPHKQFALAQALGAPTLEFPGDHDAALVQAPRFSEITLEAIEAVSPGAEAERRASLV